jgi:hypothetical protein
VALSLPSFSGCTKATAPASSAPATPAVADSKVRDLGVLQMTNHNETVVLFGPGKDCRIIPNILDRHNVQLTLTLETKDTKGGMAGLSVVQMTGDPQKQFQISVGDTNFTFVPQIADAKN